MPRTYTEIRVLLTTLCPPPSARSRIRPEREAETFLFTMRSSVVMPVRFYKLART